MKIRKVRPLHRRLSALHGDEGGMETLQVVLIVAIACVVLSLIVVTWPKVKLYFNNQAQPILNQATEGSSSLNVAQ